MTSRDPLARARRGVGSPPAIVNGSATFSVDVEQRDQVERLEDEAGPVATQAGRLVVGQLADGLALEDDLARRRPVEPAEDLEEGRLARAGRAHQGDELAGLDRQRDAAQRLDRGRSRADRTWSGRAPRGWRPSRASVAGGRRPDPGARGVSRRRRSRSTPPTIVSSRPRLAGRSTTRRLDARRRRSSDAASASAVGGVGSGAGSVVGRRRAGRRRRIRRRRRARDRSGRRPASARRRGRRRWLRSASASASGVGVAVGVGRASARRRPRRRLGRRLRVGFGGRLGRGRLPHLSANRTVHIFLPVGPL